MYPDLKPLGLNERLRFLRYDKGMYFKPHFDFKFSREVEGKRQESKLTFQLYLNEGMKGGATTFIDAPLEKNNVAVNPKVGQVLIFEHKVWHEGSILEDGRKYAMRTDIMYQRNE